MQASLKRHVALDYALVGFGALAPWLFGFSHLPAATAYTLALVLLGAGLNVVTDYPGGVWKVLPFRWHRIIEWSSPGAFVLVPWLFFREAGAMPWAVSALGLAIVANATFASALTASRPAVAPEELDAAHGPG